MKTGDLEVLSPSGTLSPDGAQLHLVFVDASGAVFGGHLAAVSLVRTTAEQVLGLLPHWPFSREPDPVAGWLVLSSWSRDPG